MNLPHGGWNLSRTFPPPPPKKEKGNPKNMYYYIFDVYLFISLSLFLSPLSLTVLNSVSFVHVNTRVAIISVWQPIHSYPNHIVPFFLFSFWSNIWIFQDFGYLFIKFPRKPIGQCTIFQVWPSQVQSTYMKYKPNPTTKKLQLPKSTHLFVEYRLKGLDSWINHFDLQEHSNLHSVEHILPVFRKEYAIENVQNNRCGFLPPSGYIELQCTSAQKLKQITAKGKRTGHPHFFTQHEEKKLNRKKNFLFNLVPAKNTKLKLT